MGQSNELGNRFDRDLYKITCGIKNLLWREKSHIRAYILISLHNGFHWSFWNRGKIFTAAEPYNENPATFRDSRIHDTHGKTTPCDIYFPEDLDLTPDQTDDILEQMRTIMGCAAKIIQPHERKYDESETAFEIFAVDFMIARDGLTNAFIVKLLEINAETGYGYKSDIVKYTEYCSQYFQWILTNVFDIKK